MPLNVIERINVKGVDYTVPHTVADDITEGSELLAASDTVHDYIHNELEITADGLQPKELSDAVTVGTQEFDIVESAVTAIAENITDTPASGSTKNLTAGGAWLDKTDTPASGSTKNLTAGGAWLDKTDTPASGSSKNITAQGYISDTYYIPEPGNTKNIRSGALHVYCDYISSSVRRWLWRALGRKLCGTWRAGTLADSTGGSSPAHCVKFANNLFVAAQGTKLLWSEDGKNWYAGMTNSDITHVAWIANIDNVWFAGGKQCSYFYTSDDGKVWRTKGFDRATGIIHFNGVWVLAREVAGSSSVSQLMWSTDLASWSHCTLDGSTLPVGTDFCSITQSNTIAVVACQGDNIDKGFLWSEDGKDWHKCTGVPSKGYYVTYAGYRFFGGSNSGADADAPALISTNGKSFSNCDGLERVTSLVFANGIYVACNSLEDLYTSHRPKVSFDGSKWYDTQGTSSDLTDKLDTRYGKAVGYGAGLFLFSNPYGIWYSESGIKWSLADTSAMSGTHHPLADAGDSAFAFGNGVHVMADVSSASYNYMKLIYSSIDDIL